MNYILLVTYLLKNNVYDKKIENLKNSFLKLSNKDFYIIYIFDSDLVLQMQLMIIKG